MPYPSSTPTALRTTRPERSANPWAVVRGALDELVDACVPTRPRRNDIGYHIWFAVHGLAVLVGRRALRDASAATHRHLEDVFFTFIGHALA